MENINLCTFTMGNNTLVFDMEKTILFCKDSNNYKKKWAKKINDVHFILDIIEDNSRYYIACEIDETQGKFLAIDKNDGTTVWFIPGRPFMQQLFNDELYLIFVDQENSFYLLKVNLSDGSKIWHHNVENDLCEYSFTKERILLSYKSGRQQKISPATGGIIQQ